MHPPDLTDHPDGLKLGDIFLHQFGDEMQTWLWQVADDGGNYWMPISVGQARGDGRVLTFTETNQKPSWLQRRWFDKRRKQSEFLLV